MARRYISSLSVYLLAFKLMRALHKCTMLVIWKLHVHPSGSRWDFLTLWRTSRQKTSAVNRMAEHRHSTVHTENFNHAPCCLWVAWETSESMPFDLPPFTVLVKPVKLAASLPGEQSRYNLPPFPVPSSQACRSCSWSHGWSIDTWTTFPTHLYTHNWQ